MTDEEAREAIAALFRWWTAPKEAVPPRFAEGFEFDSGLESPTADQWCWFREQHPGYDDVEILATVACGQAASCVFEGTESVTLLRYRIAWLAFWSDGCLRKVLETRGVVPNAKDPPRSG